ncbi:MAG TPA: hypothetical protein VFE62_00895 [Gemmataceae bacterium]|nr:hypothetical protein [Gemmataceae bacterium]
MMRPRWKRFSSGALSATFLLTLVSLAHGQGTVPPLKQVNADLSPTGTNLPSAKPAPILAAPRSPNLSNEDLQARLERQEKLIQQLQDSLLKMQQQQTAAPAVTTSAPPNSATPLTNLVQGYGPGMADPNPGVMSSIIEGLRIDEGPKVGITDGLNVTSADKLFSMKINALLQLDYRDFAHTAASFHNANSLADGFSLPRIRVFFRGSCSEFADYAVSFTSGISPNGPGNTPAPVNLLDAYLDINVLGAANKEYLQVRVGRFKTPFLYQFYKIAPQDYVLPELSMYSTNFLQNWQEGAMAHGELFDKRFEYAAGIFNGIPNGFEVPQNDREGIAMGIFRPFLLEEDSLLKRLTIAGSYAVGYQFGQALPSALGTATGSNGPPDNFFLTPIFLSFKADAIQAGFHELWNIDTIYSYKSLNFYGEVSGGTQTYANKTTPGKQVPVSLSGYSAALTYFFTGEEIAETRARVKPLRPYAWGTGNWGALEGFARFSNLWLGSNVLNNNLLTAGANANMVNATELGFHWYPNEFVRVSFDWQHSMFNQPISLDPGIAGARTTTLQDLFWLRLQLYY